MDKLDQHIEREQYDPYLTGDYPCRHCGQLIRHHTETVIGLKCPTEPQDNTIERNGTRYTVTATYPD
jgi:hypothetical protein